MKKEELLSNKLRENVEELIKSCNDEDPEKEISNLRRLVESLQQEIFQQDIRIFEAISMVQNLERSILELSNQVKAKRVIAESEELFRLQSFLAAKIISNSKLRLELEKADEENIDYNNLLMEMINLINEAEKTFPDNEPVRIFSSRLYSLAESAI